MSRFIRQTHLSRLLKYGVHFWQFFANLGVNCTKLTLRDSTPLPENVKQKIALFSVIEKRNNEREFSNSVWLFADKGWKEAYIKYCESLTTNLHTASPSNVRELYRKVLGIRNITSEWKFLELTKDECVTKLHDLVNLRHDIAHGANSRPDDLVEDNVREQTESVLSLAHCTYQTVFDYTANLSYTQALEYSLTPACFSNIIGYAAQKADRELFLREIKDLGSSEQGNHNKLCYEPWALLEKTGRSTRHITDRLIQFHNDEISLPLEILVFDNNEAIAKPDTRNVLFSELQ